MSGDQVASLTKSLWARLLNLEEKKGKYGRGERQEEKADLDKRDTPTQPGHLFGCVTQTSPYGWPCHHDSSAVSHRALHRSFSPVPSFHKEMVARARVVIWARIGEQITALSVRRKH